MPRYLTSHNMACMTKQGARELAEQMRAATAVDGVILSEAKDMLFRAVKTLTAFPAARYSEYENG